MEGLADCALSLSESRVIEGAEMIDDEGVVEIRDLPRGNWARQIAPMARGCPVLPGVGHSKLVPASGLGPGDVC